jgi:hypothetical protein
MGPGAGAARSAVKASIAASRILAVFGWLVTVLFALMELAVGVTTISEGGGSDDVTTLIVLFVILAGGVLLILLGRRIMKRVKRFRQYVGILSFQGVVSVDEIANTVAKPVDFVYADLMDMITRRYFIGAYIDAGTRSFYLRGSEAIKAPAGGEMRVAVCRGCGASNQLAVGTVGECEYCGSPIQ